MSFFIIQTLFSSLPLATPKLQRRNYDITTTRYLFTLLKSIISLAVNCTEEPPDPLAYVNITHNWDGETRQYQSEIR